MAHFAELDAHNIVQRVVVISNADIVDGDGVEQESLGIALCRNIFDGSNTWVQTSYNGNFRKKYASIGDEFVLDADLFYNPVAPFPSWTLDENYDWQAPVEYPADGKTYIWDEVLLNWQEVIEDAENVIEGSYYYWDGTELVFVEVTPPAE